jgi:ribonuclease P protein component
MKVYLRCSTDFQRVYRKGKRFEALSMTAFVLPNRLSHHRLGVTASRKAVGKAVQRNRAKRLLRETFRFKESSLRGLRGKYDWVLNAKDKLLSSKVNVAVEEFERLLANVASEESGVVESRVA